MCKPTCCSSNDSGGLGIAVAVLIGIVVISAIARPVIHVVEDILRIALIAVGTLTALAILTAVTFVVVRFRRTRRTVLQPVSPIRLHQVPETTAPHWQAQEIEPGIWACDDSQRQISVGMQSGYGMSAALYRKIQAALDAGQEVIIIDGKTGTWS